MLSKHFPLKELDKKLDHLWCLVGNTPMLEILYELDGQPHTIYAKCEHYNLTGSIKDRMALYILQKAYNEGKLQPGNKIVEATSGNTGISFSAIGRALGHPVTILMPDWLSRERRDIITSLGAEVVLVSKNQGGFKGSIEMSQAMAEQDDNVFLPLQFENIYNAEAHAKTTANEIWLQLAETGCSPSAFVAGVGTGGTVMGIARYLKCRNSTIRVHPLEPAESPTLSTGYKIGSHRIQGISDEFIPPIVQLGSLDAIISVHDGDAIIMAQQVSRQLGLAVGISSGANIAGAIKVKQQMAADAVVVTVLSDSNKKYLSTDLMKPEPVKENYLSSRVKFLDYKPLKRALR